MSLKQPFFRGLLCVLVLGAGAGLMFEWTLGFTAFTSYSYTLNKSGQVPRTAPDFSFMDQFGNARSLETLRGRYVLLHVFYGTCVTVCPVVIEQLRELYSDLTTEQRNRLAILSISVDPVRDTIGHLAELWRSEGAFEGWIIAQPAGYPIEQMAQQFGFWVLARKDGIINHSADLLLIDPEGSIVHVVSPQLGGKGIRQDLEPYL